PVGAVPLVENRSACPHCHEVCSPVIEGIVQLPRKLKRLPPESLQRLVLVVPVVVIGLPAAVTEASSQLQSMRLVLPSSSCGRYVIACGSLVKPAVPGLPVLPTDPAATFIHELWTLHTCRTSPSEV